MNFKLTTAAAAILILAASCGQNAQKQQPAEQTEEPQQEVEQAITDNDAQDSQFIEWLEKIYYKLPASVMPDYLKTEQQRRDADVFNEYTINHLIKTEFYEDGYGQWEMAAYLTEDKNNLIVIVQYGEGLDGFVTDLEKTFNYNIATGAFTEIKRPMDPITIDEVIDESLFSSPEIAAEGKKLFIESKQRVHYQDFSKDGFRIRAALDTDYDGENLVEASRIWNGSRFVKGPNWYFEDGDWVPKK